jgi:hypothetical protein
MKFQNLLLLSIEQFLVCDNTFFLFHECLIRILVMMSLDDTIARIDVSSDFLFHTLYILHCDLARAIRRFI